MRVRRLLKVGFRWCSPIALVGLFLLFVMTVVHAPKGLSQTTGGARFRVSQILDEPVIDLTGPIPFDVPRYNTFAIADVDGDGPDIVAINNEDSIVNVHLGNGDGTFEEPIGVEPGEVLDPIAVVAADFTGPFDQNQGAPDGNIDLFVTDDSGDIALLIGDGEGGFAQPDQAIDFVEDLADFISGAVSADFDEDGAADVALADDDEILFVCNDGGMLVPCPTEVVIISDVFEDAVVSDIRTGDFDGDGNTDVVAADPTGVAYLIYGDGAGNFTLDSLSQALPAGDEEARFAVTNFNNTGPDDFLGVNDQQFDFNATTFVGLGSNRRFTSTNFDAPFIPNGIATGDFDGDGTPDVVFSDSSELSYISGNESGDLSGGVGAVGVSDGFPRVNGAEVLQVADIDRDGLLDLVGLAAEGQELRVALNVRDQATATPSTPLVGTPTPPRSPTATGPTATRTMPPPTATRTPVPTAGLGRCDYNISNVGAADAARGVVVADLNGGGPDIAVSDGSRVHIIYNTGTADLRACARDQRAGDPPTDPPSSVMSEALSGAGDLAVLDTDGDGDLEIAVARPGLVSFLQINGQGVPVPIATLQATVPGNPVQIVTDYAANPIGAEMRRELDIDGDDTTDVLVANDGANSISILYGNPGGAAFTVVTQPINARSRSISAGDVTGDGRVDIVVGTDSGVLYLVQGAPSGGRPTFSTTGTATVPAPVVSLQTGFFNDDALADVFLADRTPAARILLTTATLSSPTRVLAFPLFVQASAASTMFFDPLDAALDVVVSLPDTAQLVFGLGDAAGGIARSLAPLATGPLPRDLATADVDLDTQNDVVTANGDGTVSILISSEPPPTPTPTITMTPTPVTPATEAPISTATPTATGTVPTSTPVTPSRTPTVPKPGTFQLSGGCAIADSQATDTPAALSLGLAALWAGRRRRREVD